ncbi:MAG: cyclase family protein, partial [Bacillati bacterium ANGP1]
MASPDRWWPSRYGADDELGTLNEITPAKVVAAARLVR